MILALFTIIFIFVLRKRQFTFKILALALSAFVIKGKFSLSKDARILFTDFFQAQKWAKENSPPTAIFLVDPSIYYGWRDFSERSSFGNLREWGYSSFAYNLNNHAYEEGIKRMQSIGIQVYKGITYENLLLTNMDISMTFYNLNENKLIDICRSYNLQFIVVNNKKFSINTSKLLNMYANKSFSIFKVSE